MRALKYILTLAILPACSLTDPAETAEPDVDTQWSNIEPGVWARTDSNGRVQTTGRGAGAAQYNLDRLRRASEGLRAQGGTDVEAQLAAYQAQIEELGLLLPALEQAESKEPAGLPITVLGTKSGSMCSGNYSLATSIVPVAGGQLKSDASAGWSSGTPLSTYRKKLHTQTYATGGGPPDTKNHIVTGFAYTLSSSSTSNSADPIATGGASIQISNGCVGYEHLD